MRASSTLEGRFAQIHVDAARNATDDFNPFHDPHHWQRIVANPLLGPMVRDWEANRSLPLKVKRIAIGSMAVMVGLSAWHFAGRPWLQAALIALGVIGAVVVGRIPTRGK